MLGTSVLTLLEYLELPDDPTTRTDPEAAGRLDAALRAWRAAGPEVPRCVTDRPDIERGRLAAVGQLLPAHPAAELMAWCDTALSGADAELSDLDDRFVAWQRSLCRIVAPILAHARAEALTRIEATSSGFALAAGRYWLRAVPVAIVRLLAGAFVLDMHAMRDLAAPPDVVENWFDRHLAAVCRDGATRREFFGRYPLLARLVCVRIRRWAEAGVEFAGRLERDLPALRALLTTERLTLVKVTPNLGDPHLGGRTVARVDFAEGSVAYKPRPLGAVTGLRRFLAHLRQHYGIPVEVFLPESVDRGDYGWLSWIEASPCVDDAALRRYYHRLGQLHVIAWLLGTNDLHSENIIAAGDRPYLIDAETLLTAVPHHADAGHTHPGAGTLLESPVATGIVPTGDAVDRSAFGESPGQLSGEVDTWEAAGTGDMRLVRQRLPQEHPNSAPIGADGRAVDAFDHVADFMAGTTNTLDVLAGIGLRLAADPVIDRCWAGVRMRAVLQDTAQYYRVTELLGHPAVLNNPFLAEGVFQGMLDEPAHDDRVHDAERRALLRGDVPYFEVEATGRTLLACDGAKLADFYAESPTDRLRDRAVRVAAESPGLVWATRAALRAGQINRTRTMMERTCCVNHESTPADSAALIRAAVAIGARICRLARFDGTEDAWLTLSAGGEDRWRVVTADHSLYLGNLGILIFLDTLCRIADPGGQIGRVRDRLLDRWLACDPRTGQHGHGVFDGLTGDLYAAQVISGAGIDRQTRILEVLDGSDDGHRAGLDLFAGASGIVLVLCRLARGQLGTTALDSARPYVRRILADLVTREVGASWNTVDDVPLIGFAHGSAGIVHALREFAELASDELSTQCRAAIGAATAWERSRFDAAARNWPDLRPVTAAGSTGFSYSWCNGSAGIGLARAAALRHGADDALVGELEAAVATSLEHGLGLGQALCHGDLGVTDTLLIGAEALCRPQWTDRARQIGAMVAADVLANEGCVTQEFGAGVDLPGLVNGAAGVGYQLLRIADPAAVPSVLLLEVAP